MINGFVVSRELRILAGKFDLFNVAANRSVVEGRWRGKGRADFESRLTWYLRMQE